VIHQFDPAMAPDTDFVPGALAYLVPGNTGRMLDRRRTPVRVAALTTETGTWTCEVMAFEDQGARWELPFESVTHYQFERGAASADDAALRHIRSAVRKFNRPAPLPLDPRARRPTARRIGKLRAEVAAWMRAESRFIAARGTLDLGARRGSPLLAADLEAYMRACGLWDLEDGFASALVSNPGSGEIVKVHAMALAELGLASYYGTIVRDPRSLEPPWTMERRRQHILTRLAFVREAFALLGLGPPVLYRAVSSEGALEPRRPQTFVSATFSFEVAMSLFGPAWEGRSAAIFRQTVPVERVFMTYLETAAMNRQFHEAEAVLLEDPGSPGF
jgi:hypothetical protein